MSSENTPLILNSTAHAIKDSADQAGTNSLNYSSFEIEHTKSRKKYRVDPREYQDRENEGYDDNSISTSSSNSSEPPLKSIGSWGSFVLIVNNLTGPGMLGFPHLFQQAGILPVVFTVIFVYLSSSLCGTLLADSIASIPHNQNFDRQIDFSSAFKYTVGEDWYVVAETLFLIACGVQACAGIVETAQSLDGFIASFLLGKTYAIEFYPNLKVITWTTQLCHDETGLQAESNLEDCTPFHNAGTFILTLGFLLTTLLFLPLGLKHLKETIIVQFISFVFMMILLVQFSGEFLNRGLDYSLPWVGEEFSQLAGVILFNYAFSITIPSWLNEKDNNVSVNRIVWTSSSLASAIYVSFGLMGAMAFAQVNPNILILLTSSKVALFTRFCAALFGVMIIGCGVPVFCVIIKTALENNKVCSPSSAKFFGAFLPYLISWTLYQGTLLMSMLNWTGLVVNGLVAFLLPMVLALKTTEIRSRRAKNVEIISHPEPSSFMNVVPGNVRQGAIEDIDERTSVEETTSSQFSTENDELIPKQSRQSLRSASRAPTGVTRVTGNENLARNSDNSTSNLQTAAAPVSTSLEEGGYRHYLQTRILYNTNIQPLPYWLEYYRREIVLVMMFAFASIIVLTILQDALEGITPPPPEERRRALMKFI